MTDFEGINTQFPNVEEWSNENKKVCEKLEDEIKSPDYSLIDLLDLKNDSKSSKDDSQNYFKTKKRRRLSDSFSDDQYLIADSLHSTRKKLSKFLPLLLIQALAKRHAFKKDTPFLLQKQQKDNVSNILQSLLIVMRAAIDTPSEKQILEYCQIVLEETTAGVKSSVVVNYFLDILISSDIFLNQATLLLLYSYCLEKQFDLLVALELLRDIIPRYSDDNLKILELYWKIVTVVVQNLKFIHQVQIVSEVSLVVKCTVFNSKDKEHLPGLCHSEGFDSIFLLYEKVILAGTMKDKKIAARAFRQLIIFSSEDALQPFLCRLAGILICNILKYRNAVYIYTKVALVEALTTLLAKLGINLKLHFTSIQGLFLRTLRSDSHKLQLACIRGLCCSVRFNSQLDTLYHFLHEMIAKENSTVKTIMLFALRYIIKCACVPMSIIFQRRLTILLISMLNHDIDSTRIAAAACMGTIFGLLPSFESRRVMQIYFLDDNSKKWKIKHSKCIAIMITLKETPAKLLHQKDVSEKIGSMILSYMTSNEVSLVIDSIKACGYFMLYKLSLHEERINPILLNTFCKAITSDDSDAQHTFASVTNFLANRITLPLYIIRHIVPFLMSGSTKDRNIKVKSSCEYALVSVLDLYNHDRIAQMYLNTLKIDTQELFQNVLKHLKVIAKLPKPKVEEPDIFKIWDI